MMIRYENTIDDVVAFNRYHLAHSATIRNAKIRWIVFSVIGCLIAAAFGYQIQPEVIPGTIGAVLTLVVAGAVFALVYYLGFYSLPERQMRKLLAEGRNDGMVGFHELVIDDGGISEKTDVGESKQMWKAINRIEETEDFAFLYVTAISAHVIPKHRVTNGDPARFIKHARELFAPANH